MSLIIFNTFNLKDNVISAVGWVLISLILVSLGCTWILLFPSIAVEMYHKIKEIIVWFRKGNSNENDENSQSSIVENSNKNNITKEEAKKKEEKETNDNNNKISNEGNEASFPELTFRPK